MDFPLNISFRNMDPSPAVENRIREKVAKLSRLSNRIIGCSVVVEAPHRHQHKGKLYHVHIDISVPGKDLVVDRAKPLASSLPFFLLPCLCSLFPAFLPSSL